LLLLIIIIDRLILSGLYFGFSLFNFSDRFLHHYRVLGFDKMV